MIAKHMTTFTLVLTCLASVAPAQEDAAVEEKPSPATSTPQIEGSAPQLVREGNKLLLDDKAKLALQKYDQAKTLAPTAREIAFAEGLSHFKLGDYATAREEFSQVAGSADDALADDALYSRGTCDHAEALASSQEPQQAMGKLESAMRTYRDVLARNPNHAAARDANFKAASMWRQLKQQMQQQEKQQKSDSDKDNKEQDDQEKQDQQKQDDQKGDEQKQDQQQDSEDQQSKEQQSSDSEQDKKQEQQQDQSKSDEQKESEQKQAQQSQEEQVSKEQAERKLREMLQELADRKKARQKPLKSVPIPRGGKDW